MILSLLIEKISTKTHNEIFEYLNNKYYFHLKKKILKNPKKSLNQKVFIGFFFHLVEKNYEEAKKYYLIAIDKGSSTAMNKLASYYEDIEKN
jgi:TPR repeat protein